MSVKTKLTFYCDEPDCKVNQTFVTSIDRPMHTVSGRGDTQSVMGALTKQMGWKAGIGQVDGEKRILTLCPTHRDRPGDLGLTSI